MTSYYSAYMKCKKNSLASRHRVAAKKKAKKYLLPHPAINSKKSAKKAVKKAIKKTKKATVHSAPVLSEDKKLSKSDPDYYSKIGHISGEKLLLERGTRYFSEIAKLSHPRAEYHGGRPALKKKSGASSDNAI